MVDKEAFQDLRSKAKFVAVVALVAVVAIVSFVSFAAVISDMKRWSEGTKSGYRDNYQSLLRRTSKFPTPYTHV